MIALPNLRILNKTSENLTLYIDKRFIGRIPPGRKDFYLSPGKYFLEAVGDHQFDREVDIYVGDLVDWLIVLPAYLEIEIQEICTYNLYVDAALVKTVLKHQIQNRILRLEVPEGFHYVKLEEEGGQNAYIFHQDFQSGETFYWTVDASTKE